VTALAGFRPRASAAAPVEETTASDTAPADGPSDTTAAEAAPGSEEAQETAPH
jgi:hypothetical protein